MTKEEMMNIRKLGFGLMRLPAKKEEKGIDVEQVKRMVDLFMEAGYTYFDTAYLYSGSEAAIREALVERYPRDSYQLATKNAAWFKAESREEAVKQFETSLENTGLEYFDFYLLHNINREYIKYFDGYDMWNVFAEQKRKGLIKNFGFSFHDSADMLEEVLTAHPDMDFVQLQINYADWESPEIQSRACYEVARKHDMPIIIMEPIKGGMLASPPEEVEAVFKEADPEAGCASWALRFAADLEGVVTVLSGMSSVEQMEENLKVMDGFRGLSDGERAVIEKARRTLAEIPIIPCTACAYCEKVCPNDVGISRLFRAMNDYTLYHNFDMADHSISWNVDRIGRRRAEGCVKCGACEDACPQNIQIRQELDRIAELFPEPKK